MREAKVATLFQIPVKIRKKQGRVAHAQRPEGGSLTAGRGGKPAGGLPPEYRIPNFE
jgi:hypothetical protein